MVPTNHRWHVGHTVILAGKMWGAKEGSRIQIKKQLARPHWYVCANEIRVVDIVGASEELFAIHTSWSAMSIEDYETYKRDQEKAKYKTAEASTVDTEREARVAKLKDELVQAVKDDWARVGSDRVLNVMRALQEAERIPLPTVLGFYIATEVEYPSVYQLSEDGWTEGQRQVSEEELYHNTEGKLARMAVAAEVLAFIEDKCAPSKITVQQARKRYVDMYTLEDESEVEDDPAF